MINIVLQELSLLVVVILVLVMDSAAYFIAVVMLVVLVQPAIWAFANDQISQCITCIAFILVAVAEGSERQFYANFFYFF